MSDGASRTVLFLVATSPDPQTISALLVEDSWSARNMRPVVEYAPYAALPQLGTLPPGVEVHAWRKDEWDRYASAASATCAGDDDAMRFGWQVAYWHARLRELGASLLVVGNESQPSTRAAGFAAAALGIPSAHMQHGLPAAWWGYVPSVADAVLVWGPSSAQRFADWGVEPSRLRETGSPRMDALVEQVADARARRDELRTSSGIAPDARVILLPEGLRAMHGPLFESLRTAMSDVLSAQPRAVLLLRPHPAEDPAAVLEQMRGAMSGLEHRLAVHAGSLAEALAISDLVVVHRSTIGAEAAGVGLPAVSFDPVAEGRPPYGPGSGMSVVSDGAALSEFVSAAFAGMASDHAAENGTAPSLRFFGDTGGRSRELTFAALADVMSARREPDPEALRLVASLAACVPGRDRLARDRAAAAQGHRGVPYARPTLRTRAELRWKLEVKPALAGSPLGAAFRALKRGARSVLGGRGRP